MIAPEYLVYALDANGVLTLCVSFEVRREGMPLRLLVTRSTGFGCSAMATTVEGSAGGKWAGRLTPDELLAVGARLDACAAQRVGAPS